MSTDHGTEADLHIMRFDWGTGKWTCTLCGMVDNED